MTIHTLHIFGKLCSLSNILWTCANKLFENYAVEWMNAFDDGDDDDEIRVVNPNKTKTRLHQK